MPYKHNKLKDINFAKWYKSDMLIKLSYNMEASSF